MFCDGAAAFCAPLPPRRFSAPILFPARSTKRARIVTALHYERHLEDMQVVRVEPFMSLVRWTFMRSLAGWRIGRRIGID